MEYKLIRTKRRTLSVSIDKDLQIIVRSPLRLSVAEIEVFLDKSSGWIETHQEKMRQQIQLHRQNTLTDEQISQLRSRASQLLPQRVAYFSKITGLFPTGIKITSASRRWGSCNHKNSLCFSYRLMLLEPQLIDLVVVHELCHIAEKNHGTGFHSLMERYLPDCRQREKLLRLREHEL